MELLTELLKDPRIRWQTFRCNLWSDNYGIAELDNVLRAHLEQGLVANGPVHTGELIADYEILYIRVNSHYHEGLRTTYLDIIVYFRRKYHIS